MSTDAGKEIRLEIGHVLFIDIVGYSKLLINEQSEQLQTLKEIVRGTEQVRLAEGEGKLLRLPTGDGGALVLRTSPEAGEKEWALQQFEAELRARMASLLRSYGALKLLSFWDPLRGDPRFEQIIASLAPKEPPK